MRSVGIVAVLVLATSSLVSGQQKARPAAAAGGSSAQDLATGWSALASGRTADAEAIAEKLLLAGSRRHDAVSLKISARVRAGRADAALDPYEEWLKTSPHEDVFLLQPIAAGILEGHAGAKDAGVRVDALQALAEAGDKGAASKLAALAASGENPGVADEALARVGNPQAVARLTRLVAAPGGRRDLSGVIDALVKAKPAGAVAALTAALDPGRPMPTKMAAAKALGTLGAAEAIPQLRRALQDPEPPVRMMAALSLARLGDQSGNDLIRNMENSPVADIRLMAAAVSAPNNPTGAWVSTATGALEDPDPGVRLSAAQLLLAHGADRTAAAAAMNRALADPNPALRLLATRAVAETPPEAMAGDVPSLRRLLRDSDPRVQIVAAGVLLKLAGGVDQ
ncbi:MAG TPA: HEAT repeat domain-containing protein [Vicinamibacterales bacterium]|nr:HEAT repeat domain-containing protein [Vicinamibacterales bacterium]